MGLSPHMKIKKGRPLVNWPGGNTPPVIAITPGFNATPSIGANPDTSFFAVATDAEQGDISANIVWNTRTADAILASAGIAFAQNGQVGATNSAIAAATYDVDATVDGGGLIQAAIVIGGGESYTAIAALINAQVAGATVTFVDSTGFLFTSDTTGIASTVVVGSGTGVNTDLFAALDAAESSTTTFPAPVDGVAAAPPVVSQVGSGGNPSISFVVTGSYNIEASITDGFSVTVVDTAALTVGA